MKNFSIFAASKINPMSQLSVFLTKTRRFMVCVLLAGLFQGVFAQAPSPSGPVVGNFSREHYDKAVMADNDREFVAYGSPIWVKLKKCTHSIITYDKEQQTVAKRDLTLSDNYKRLLAYDAGDTYFVTYSRYPKSTVFEYSVASIPKDCAAGYTVTPQTKLTFSIDHNGFVMEYTAESPDHTKHAVAFVYVNKKQKAENFYFLVYDKEGNELLYKVLSPEIYGDSFSVEDLAVTNDGKALMLMRTGTKERQSMHNTAVHILCCGPEGGQSYVKPVTFGVIQSMRLLVLKNGDYFVGGYYGEKSGEPTSGYFSCICRQDQEDFDAPKHYAFPGNHRPKHEFMLAYMLKYFTKCAALHELANGEVVMLGEHRAMVISTGNGTTYYHYADDIVYQYFNKDGEMTHQQRVPKNQAKQFEQGANDIAPTWFTYDKLGISFTSFVKGNAVYVLYQDSQANYNKHDKTPAQMTMGRGNTCTVLARLDSDGPERDMVMLPGKAKRTLHNLWLFDGNKFYFGMASLKDYSIESRSLDELFQEE